MSEQKIVSMTFQEQKAIKPLIEDAIIESLDGGMKKAALDFIAYMRENKMKPVWAVTNQWKAMYRGKCICRIYIKNGEYDDRLCASPFWVVRLDPLYLNEYEESILSEGLQNMIWDNASYCVHKKSGTGCNPNKPCVGGRTMTLFGNEIKGICVCPINVNICDPDDATINRIKKLLAFEKKARANIT